MAAKRKPKIKATVKAKAGICIDETSVSATVKRNPKISAKKKVAKKKASKKK